MDITVNGEKKNVKPASCLAALLVDLGYQGLSVAVALNRTCVRRQDLATTPVADGDDLEILAPAAGG